MAAAVQSECLAASAAWSDCCCAQLHRSQHDYHQVHPGCGPADPRHPRRLPSALRQSRPECHRGRPATLQPQKKPRHRELYPSEKALNQLLSRYRVTVEHAIAGIKRCRIVLDTFRCWRRGLVDEVMLAASGLQNLRVRTGQPA